MKMLPATSLMLFVCLTVSPVFAGVYFEGTTRTTDGTVQEKSVIYLNADRLRVENQETKGASVPDIIIFRQDKKVMWVIHSKEGTYTEITNKDLEEMKSKMDESMKMMQEQMKNMPPEQRKMMEEMMAKQMPKGMMTQEEKTTFKKAASGVKFRSWNCDKYEGFKGSEKSAEVLTILPSQAGFNMKDFMVMRDFAEFFSPLAVDANEFVMMGTEEDVNKGGFQGMPVKYVNMSNGKITDTFELEKIESRTNPASLFELPADLKKKEIW